MKTSSSAFYCADLLLLNARRIQAFLQQQDFLIAFDASELLLCFQQSCGGPPQRLISFAPTLYVSRPPLHRRPARFDPLGGRQFPPPHRSITPIHRRWRFRPRSPRSSTSPLTPVVFSVAPCHTPKTCFAPPSAIPRATTSTWPPK